MVQANQNNGNSLKQNLRIRDAAIALLATMATGLIAIQLTSPSAPSDQSNSPRTSVMQGPRLGL